jgi:hypothetical protein
MMMNPGFLLSSVNLLIQASTWVRYQRGEEFIQLGNGWSAEIDCKLDFSTIGSKPQSIHLITDFYLTVTNS